MANKLKKVTAEELFNIVKDDYLANAISHEDLDITVEEYTVACLRWAAIVCDGHGIDVIGTLDSNLAKGCLDGLQ